MTSKKKEINENILIEKVIEIFNKNITSSTQTHISKSESNDISTRIETGIRNFSTGDQGFNQQLYMMNVIKINENLKNPYVINCIKDHTFIAEDLVLKDKYELNPTKWQKIHDDRLPKNLKEKEKPGLMNCPLCKSCYTKYTTAQIRSADEPSTIFFTCSSCEHKWKR